MSEAFGLGKARKDGGSGGNSHPPPRTDGRAREPGSGRPVMQDRCIELHGLALDNAQLYAESRKSLQDMDFTCLSTEHNTYYAMFRTFFGLFRGKDPPLETKRPGMLIRLTRTELPKHRSPPKFFSHPGGTDGD